MLIDLKHISIFSITHLKVQKNATLFTADAVRCHVDLKSCTELRIEKTSSTFPVGILS